MNIHRIHVLAIVLSISLSFSASVHAQTTFGTITGNLKDTTGAVLPDVTITVLNERTGATRQVSTDSSGTYTVPSLLPSVYTITAELKGFKMAVTPSVTLEVNQTLRVDFTLQVGEVTQTIEVEAQAPLLQSETSTVGTVVDNKQVVELPLNGRSFTELTTLVPGAVPTGPGPFKTSGTNVAVSGGRYENNNYTLDGVNNNETFFLSYAIQPSIDAIQEFKIQTNITSSEFGSAAGPISMWQQNLGQTIFMEVSSSFCATTCLMLAMPLPRTSPSSGRISLVLSLADPSGRTRLSSSSTMKGFVTAAIRPS